MEDIRNRVLAASIDELPEYFEFYHSAPNAADSRGFQITAHKAATTVRDILDSIIETHAIRNPGRLVVQVTIGEEVIAGLDEGVLQAVQGIGDSLFAKAFVALGGVEEEVCLYSVLE
jgi:hypothetical protein